MRELGRPELPAEDVYATAKKICFVLERIRRYRQQVNSTPRILDFGCGNGAALGHYVIGEGVDYLGVDFHAPSLDYARAHFGERNARFLPHVPAGERFDILIYSEVLEHLDDPSAILRSHLPLLAPGGMVLGSIPNGYGLTEIEKYVDRKLHLYEALRWVWRRLRGGGLARQEEGLPYNHACGHVQFFTRRSFERAVCSAGLEVAELRNGSVMGADLSGATFLRPHVLIEFNTKLADYLPAWAAATWHFTLHRAKEA
ncbi:conserved hypothetical protein [Candidatus Propionivibrio aalborgensis]|uniref:Uncharacterized protein n=1 Tax=Candidatus Propionivibrio aalborgensis TaxID=1860101 RepID=A0A1A8XXI2_9RHOO|nr:class I SAM-dependent methyltransferase [Candidatus Propionivibrio aalborgensis]SBT09357.1 conserved hypothetical protein [Candidatus Propionivibrio aalborgensis]